MFYRFPRIIIIRKHLARISLVIKTSLGWQVLKNISTKALLCPVSLTFFLCLFLITPFPSHLSHFCQPLIFCIPLLSSPFSNHVFISAPASAVLCVRPSFPPSPLVCLPEAGEDDIWMQLVGCPGSAAGVVPAGHLLLWSWRTRPAAAEHRERAGAGGSSSNEPHQNPLCFVSLVKHCRSFMIIICHMAFPRWWMTLYLDAFFPTSHFLYNWVNLLAGFADLCPYCRYGLAAVSELLSTVVCLKGLTLIHMSNGGFQVYKEAMTEFLSSVRWWSPA